LGGNGRRGTAVNGLQFDDAIDFIAEYLAGKLLGLPVDQALRQIQCAAHYDLEAF
jgi:hypothetical protein